MSSGFSNLNCYRMDEGIDIHILHGCLLVLELWLNWSRILVDKYVPNILVLVAEFHLGETQYPFDLAIFWKIWVTLSLPTVFLCPVRTRLHIMRGSFRKRRISLYIKCFPGQDIPNLPFEKWAVTTEINVPIITWKTLGFDKNINILS